MEISKIKKKIINKQNEHVMHMSEKKNQIMKVREIKKEKVWARDRDRDREIDRKHIVLLLWHYWLMTKVFFGFKLNLKWKWK